MIPFTKIATFHSGTPQFRIGEDLDPQTPCYYLYSQTDLEEDLKGLFDFNTDRRQIRTHDVVITASAGDIVFSLLSGTAALIQKDHEGFLLTQNYVVITPSNDLDHKYLVYLLNENPSIRHQLRIGQQGSVVGKYTLNQLKSLELPPLPEKEKQQLIGELYCNQLKLEALRKHVAELETTLVFEQIKEVFDHE